MTDQQTEKVLKEYQIKSDTIIKKMYDILVRAQRKVDDKRYREALEKIK